VASRGGGVLLVALLCACGALDTSDDGPTQPAPSTCSAGSDACAFVAAHNTVRASVTPAPSPALPDVAWSSTAADAAGAWAQQCTWSHDPGLGTLSLGQNLYASTGQPAPSSVVAAWTDEASDYDYATNSCASGRVCGHYTQVVWRSSVGLGCAMVRCTTGSPFGSAGGGVWWNVVCDYAPPGNRVGQRPY
jgi:hypothetical protein